MKVHKFCVQTERDKVRGRSGNRAEAQRTQETLLKPTFQAQLVQESPSLVKKNATLRYVFVSHQFHWLVITQWPAASLKLRVRVTAWPRGFITLAPLPTKSQRAMGVPLR